MKSNKLITLLPNAKDKISQHCPYLLIDITKSALRNSSKNAQRK